MSPAHERDGGGFRPWRGVRTAGVPQAPHPAQTAPPAETARPADTALPGNGVRPVVIGKPIYEFEPRPTLGSGARAFRPDTVIDGWASGGLLVRGASVRGYSHRWEGIPRQDDFAVIPHDGTGGVLVAVADGVGSAPLSHVGATWAVHTAVGWLAEKLDAEVPAEELPWQELLTECALALVAYARDHLAGPARDTGEAERQLATTLVAGLILPRRDGAATAHVVSAGDSGVWLLRDRVFTSMAGGKSSGIDEVAESAVDHPLPALSPVPPRPVRIDLSPGDVLLLGTDGFGDPLGSGTGEVGRAFAGCLGQPPSALGFAQLLDFSRELYDDDRTLVAVWPGPAQRP